MTSDSGWISGNVAAMQISAIKEMAMRSSTVPGAASLTWGLPSFRTPAHIRRRVAEMLDRDPEIGKYALPDGLQELRETVASVLVSPSNPTGTIFTEPELRRVGEIALERNVLVFLDDPYRHFCYENAEMYFNLASVPETSGQLAYLFTFSKSYAMSGWRLAYMIVPEQLKRQALKVHDATIICTPRISQVAGLAALTEEPVHLAEFEKILAKRRAVICERLDNVGHVFDYVKPEGAYYVFPRIVAEHTNSVDFTIRLLEEAKVTVTPGSAFGAGGEHHVRMAFCVAEETIQLAFDRIEALFPK